MFYWFLNNHIWLLLIGWLIYMLFNYFTRQTFFDTDSTINTYTKIMRTKNKKGYIIEL